MTSRSLRLGVISNSVITWEINNFLYICTENHKNTLSMKKLFLSLFGTFCSLMPATAGTPIMVGHRGSNIGVESSTAALEVGGARGYAFLESDLKVAGDGTFVLSHDDTTERLGSGLKVAESTGADLLADTLRQTRWDVPYVGFMATLGDMLDICKKYGTRPLIELKWATGINSNDTSGIPALIEFITEKGMRDKCMILTSMKPCLEYIRANYPDVELQLLVQTKVDENFDWCVEHNMGIDIHHSAVTPERVERFHAAGLPVNVWTVNSEEDRRRFADMGVDYITTDSLLP